MPRITYKAMTPDDPAHTQVGAYRFEHGKAVEVDDETHAMLSKNPWFTGDKRSREAAEARVSTTGLSPGPDSGLDSSIMPAYPPGSGMKYAPDSVTTAQGIKPAADLSEADLVDNANTVEDPKEAKKAGRVVNKG